MKEFKQIRNKFEKKYTKSYCPKCNKITYQRVLGFEKIEFGLISYNFCAICKIVIKTLISWKDHPLQNIDIISAMTNPVDYEISVVNLNQIDLKSLISFDKLIDLTNERLRKHGYDPDKIKKDFEKKYGKLD